MNKVFMIGRLTSNPELRHTTSGTPVCKINLAVNRPKQKDKEQETDFINVIVWDKQGENLAQYQTKGNLIAIEGKIQTSSYEGKDGKKVYTTEIVATNVQYLESSKKEIKNEVKETQEEIQNKDPYAEFGEQITVEDLDKGMDLPF